MFYKKFSLFISSIAFQYNHNREKRILLSNHKHTEKHATENNAEAMYTKTATMPEPCIRREQQCQL